MITETRTYTIPLRDAYQEKPPHQKAPRAVKAVKSFLSRHMKAEKDSVKVSSSLNQVIWADGARNPPAKVTVVAEPREADVHVMTEDEYAEQPEKEDQETIDDEDEEQDAEDQFDEASDESSNASSDDEDTEDKADDAEES